MNYFVIKASRDKNVIGHYPQVKEVKQNCNVLKEKKFVEHINFEEVNYEPITANAVLYNSSKATDLIDALGVSFTKKLLVSGKLKSIILNHRKDGLQFFKSPVIWKNNHLNDYWIINNFNVKNEYLDFEKSQIFETFKVFEKVSVLNIATYKEYVKITGEINEKGYPYGFLIEKFEIHHSVKDDFFVVSNVEGGVKYIVSETLKNAIEDQNCQGIDFMPANMKLSEWISGRKGEERS